MPKASILLLLGALACFGQTCAITSPTKGQLFQAPQPLQLTASVASAPSAYKLIWSVDSQRWANGYAKNPHLAIDDPRDRWVGPWAATWYTGLNGDGAHTVSGMVYDIFGNTLATCSPIAFTVRIEGMSNQSVNAFPTSGTGKWGMLTFDGTNAQNTAVSQMVDGRPLPYDSYCGGAETTGQTGGWQVANFNTACFPNGPHLIYSGYYLGSIGDPYVLSKTFRSSDVSGNNIAIANHYSVEGSVVTFSTTGTLAAPLVAGCQFYWATSPSNTNTARLSVSGGVITVHISSPCGLAAGIPIYLRNVQWTSASGQATCDGYYKMATGSGTTFTVTAPAGCPNGVAATENLEVDINPYFVEYVDRGHIAVAATPAGSTIQLTTRGSGTSTLLQRIRSPYWTSSGANGEPGPGPDFAKYGGEAYVEQLVTFSNGTKPMEIEVPYWEMHLIAGAPASSTCPKIKNTDLSFTTISCNATGLTYQEVDDGGLSGVCSVDASGNVTPIMAGWCQVHVQCSSCVAGGGAGGTSLPTVTVYIQVHSGSITFPHFTHRGAIATAFSPGNSFFPLSAWQLNIIGATPYQSNPVARNFWYGPMMQEANLNTAMIAPDPSNVAFGDASGKACVSASWPSKYHAYESAFATQYGIYFEADTEPTQWGPNGPGSLAVFLNNIGYDRQRCFTGWLNGLASEGRTYRTFSYDELNQYMAGANPFRNPNLGSKDFPSVTVRGGVATYNVAETFTGVWNQQAGTGSWIKMAGAVKNTCLNGWFPVTGITDRPINGGRYPASFTTPTTCADGAYTESTAQLYHYWAGGGIGENAGVLPRLLGTSAADQSGATIQHWDPAYFTQVVMSGCTASACTAEFSMPSHGIANNQAIRVQGSAHNLNIVAPISVIDPNHFTITYRSLFGSLPSSGTYNAIADPKVFVTVDENFPPTPLLSLRNVITSVAGHPATTWSVIGFTFNPGNPAVYNWTGNALGEDAANDYVPEPPTHIYGPDASVWQWANYSQSTSGLATRAYQLQPRAMLWGAGLYYLRYCRSFNFDPVCDRPTQLDWRPETLVTQMMAMLTLDASALRLYNFVGNMNDLYNLDCCGWNAHGTGAGMGINPFISPKQWSAMARTDTLIKLREDTELQPSANKPYMGPMFLTDAHTSSTYGNQLTILCASEMPYGVQTVTLPRISGGSIVKYVLTGYSLSVKVLSGNPVADKDEFCSVPGRTTAYVALPASPAVNPMDSITFSAPSPLPFGASKFLLQVGYYRRAMEDDPVTDCTQACTIQVDHHNTSAWYRVIYADSNNLPLSIGEPIQIPSQGLF